MFRVKAVNAAGYSLSSTDSDAVVVQAAICESSCVSLFPPLVPLVVAFKSYPPVCAPFLWECLFVQGMTA